MTTGSFSRVEIEEIVTMVRLSLYNRGRSCGAHAILKELAQLHVQPLPSLSTIKRILTRRGLTHGRTGHYL
jgi:putative transposase